MLPRHCKQNLLGGGAGLLLAAATTGALLALGGLALAATALLGGAASLATLTTEKYTNRTTFKNLSKPCKLPCGRSGGHVSWEP